MRVTVRDDGKCMSYPDMPAGTVFGGTNNRWLKLADGRAVELSTFKLYPAQCYSGKPYKIDEIVISPVH